MLKTINENLSKIIKYMSKEEEYLISKVAEGVTKGAISVFLDKINPSKFYNCLKKEYCILKFGPKAKNKKGLQIGRKKGGNSDKVYISYPKRKKYYWIKTRKILYGLGYAMSDTYKEISIDNYTQGNPIYWEY